MSLISLQHGAVDTAAPRPLPNDLYQAAAGSPVEHLPFKTWEGRAVARFTYPNTQAGGPDGTRVYNMSPVWCRGDESGTGANLDWKYLKVDGKADFSDVVGLAQTLASERDSYGSWKNGSQAILQARDGSWYLASLEGWGDEVPVQPGDPGGAAGPYHLEEVLNAGGVVTRYTPALRAVVGATTWVDFSGHDAKVNKVY